MTPPHGTDAERLEIDLLLHGISKRYGYDFSHYSYASLKRRLDHVREQAHVPHFTGLLDKIFHEQAFFDEFLRHMSITVTEMFRDPLFYRAVREKVVPILKTFPYAKIWHAGCSSGEEVYSMAILLHEENCLDRVRVYATDFNKHALDIAQKAVYPIKNADMYAANYKSAGGQRDFSEYYSAGYDLIKIKDSFKRQITFSYHNLVTDGVFGEMNMICCRNVLIYFDRTLQNRVLSLFSESLRYGGFLCLGSRETLNFTDIKPFFESVEAKQKIFKKQGFESAAA